MAIFNSYVTNYQRVKDADFQWQSARFPNLESVLARMAEPLQPDTDWDVDPPKKPGNNKCTYIRISVLFVCIYICTHIYIHIYICTHIYIHIYTYIYICIYIHICISIYIYVHICIYIHIHIHIHIYTHIYIIICICLKAYVSN